MNARRSRDGIGRGGRRWDGGRFVPGRSLFANVTGLIGGASALEIRPCGGVVLFEIGSPCGSAGIAGLLQARLVVAFSAGGPNVLLRCVVAVEEVIFVEYVGEAAHGLGQWLFWGAV